MQTRSRARDSPPVEVAQHESSPPTAGLVLNSGRPGGGIGDPTRLVVSEQGQEPQIHMETAMSIQATNNPTPTQVLQTIYDLQAIPQLGLVTNRKHCVTCVKFNKE